jgi:transcriptional regulator with XRE-family HTH domain
MSDSVERLRYLVDEFQDDPDYELYGVLLDVTESIVRRMIEKNIRRTDLAERLGTSRAYVTKLLDGQENMTLKTLVRVANALEMKVDTRFIPREKAARPAMKLGVKSDTRRGYGASTATKAVRTRRSSAPAKTAKKTTKRAVATRSKR